MNRVSLVRRIAWGLRDNYSRLVYSRRLSLSSMVSRYSTVEFGSKYSNTFSAYIHDSTTSSVVSPFHDIPTFSNEKENLVNVVIEIPRFSSAKLEISTKSPMNPIIQDQKNGKPRFVKNLFPFHGYPWNYGALPQTWEDPDVVDQFTNAKGDNDPVDVIEIGSKICRSGEVVVAKVLGCVALIDQGETDWKVFVLNVEDPLASKVHNFDDVRNYFPHLLEQAILWLRYYKVADGNKINGFAFEGEYFKDREFAMNIIRESRKAWEKLVSLKSSPLSLRCLDTKSAHAISKPEINKILESCPPASSPTPLPDDVLTYNYVRIKELDVVTP